MNSKNINTHVQLHVNPWGPIGIKACLSRSFGSKASTMKLTTILIFALVLMGASAINPRKLFRKCDIDPREFCESGRPTIRPADRDCRNYVGTTLERGERPEMEDCEVGETVSFTFRFNFWNTYSIEYDFR